MIRYGILSTASIAARFVQGVRESGEAKVVAIASRSEIQARNMAEKLQIPRYYATYDELFLDPDIDVIYIPTMNAIHYRDAKKALESNKHVIVEKPFVLESKQVDELFALAKKQNKFIMEAQKSVFLPTTEFVKQKIEEGVIGEVKYVELKASFLARFEDDHWMFDAHQGGGCLHGSASYTIELMQYLFGETTIQAAGSQVSGHHKSDEICTFSFVLDKKILVSSTIAMNVLLPNEAVIYGTKGSIKIPNYWKSEEVQICVSDNVETHKFPCTSEFVFEINHIHKCIQENKVASDVMTLHKTKSCVAMVEQLYKQWKLK